MSEEQLKAFLERVKADTSLQEKLKAATSPEAAIEIAKETGFSITAEDIQSMQPVSERELEDAAGGRGIGGCGDVCFFARVTSLGAARIDDFL